MRNHQALLDLYKYTKAMNRMGGLRIEVQKGAREGGSCCKGKRRKKRRGTTDACDLPADDTMALAPMSRPTL